TEWLRMACSFDRRAIFSFPSERRAAARAALIPARPLPTITRSQRCVSSISDRTFMRPSPGRHLEYKEKAPIRRRAAAHSSLPAARADLLRHLQLQDCALQVPLHHGEVSAFLFLRQ